uniref:Uncharacterized protein n=1 Tax=Opuntia streptacantha TaxID=393608 RepID=A0A7C9AS37_OPUST
MVFKIDFFYWFLTSVSFPSACRYSENSSTWGNLGCAPMFKWLFKYTCEEASSHLLNHTYHHPHVSHEVPPKRGCMWHCPTWRNDDQLDCRNLHEKPILGMIFGSRQYCGFIFASPSGARQESSFSKAE